MELLVGFILFIAGCVVFKRAVGVIVKIINKGFDMIESKL